jgi:Zn-finger nucleic acid-binding protein
VRNCIEHMVSRDKVNVTDNKVPQSHNMWLTNTEALSQLINDDGGDDDIEYDDDDDDNNNNNNYNYNVHVFASA